MGTFESAPKIFTVEQATYLIPKIVEVLKKLRKQQGSIQKLEERKAIEELSWLREDGTVSPNAKEAISKLEESQRKDLHRFEEILEELDSLGGQLKDLDQGLIDFFGARGDSLIYLCWKEGEDKIRYWHDLEAGFARRLLLQEL